MEELPLVFLIFLLMFGLSYFAVSRVVEETVFERTDRVALAFLVGISVHIPFYIVIALELNAWLLLITYAAVWACGIFYIKSRIKIPFTLNQSLKLYLLIFWSFLKIIFVAAGILALIKVAIVGVLLLVDSL